MQFDVKNGLKSSILIFYVTWCVLIYGCYVVSGSNFLVTNHKERKNLIKFDLCIFTVYKNVDSQCYASSAFFPRHFYDFFCSFFHQIKIPDVLPQDFWVKYVGGILSLDSWLFKVSRCFWHLWFVIFELLYSSSGE